MTLGVREWLKSRGQKHVPYALRVELARMRRWPSRQAEWRGAAEQESHPEILLHVLAHGESTLHRGLQDTPRRLVEGKISNIGEVISRIDKVVVKPGQRFSYHALVGRPSLLRGFRFGLELHNETMASGVGGGACKVSNLIYQLALKSGMEIVERHRHSLDLFPDKERKVPFGLGATVFYNYADLQFKNVSRVPIQMCLSIKNGKLVGEIKASIPNQYTYEVYEVDHKFTKVKDGWIRSNEIWRKTKDKGGKCIKNECIAKNRARVLYQPNLPLSDQNTE